jgi:hypothetical protein
MRAMIACLRETRFAATGFFIGGPLCYHSLLPVLASSAFGSVLGLIVAARVLRKNELPISATLGDMKARLLREGVKSESPNWKMRGLGCLTMGLSLVVLSGYMLIDTYIHHNPTLSMLAAGVIVTAMGVGAMKRPSSSQSMD